MYEMYHVDLYIHKLSNQTLRILETLNLSNVYADRDGYDECMRAGSLKTSLSTNLNIYMYYILFMLDTLVFV